MLRYIIRSTMVMNAGHLLTRQQRRGSTECCQFLLGAPNFRPCALSKLRLENHPIALDKRSVYQSKTAVKHTIYHLFSWQFRVNFLHFKNRKNEDNTEVIN